MDYAGAVSTERVRCFRFIYDADRKPDNCPQSLVATGWLQIGPKWHPVDGCGEHSAQLLNMGLQAFCRPVR